MILQRVGINLSYTLTHLQSKQEIVECYDCPANPQITPMEDPWWICLQSDNARSHVTFKLGLSYLTQWKNHNLTEKNVIIENVYKVTTFKLSQKLATQVLTKWIILKRLQGLTLDHLSIKTLKVRRMLGQTPQHPNKERVTTQEYTLEDMVFSNCNTVYLTSRRSCSRP